MVVAAEAEEVGDGYLRQTVGTEKDFLNVLLAYVLCLHAYLCEMVSDLGSYRWS